MNEKNAQLLDVAAQQNAIVTRPQARANGLTDGEINGCIANGLLIVIADQVYRVRGAPQTELMAVTAAAMGAQGRASHATATRLLRLATPLTASPIHVTVDGTIRQPRIARVEVEHGMRKFFAVKVHRFTDFAEPTATIDGVLCVDAARALIDVAAALSAENLEAAFEQARRLGLVSTESLARRFALIGGRGRPGTPKVRELLGNAQPNPLDSKLEVKAWRLLRASRLENPERQVQVNLPSGQWYRLDFAWPELLLAFETEGFEWHGSRARWKQDRVRTAALERLGWRVVVATWEDVVNEPAATLDRLAQVVDERRSIRRASSNVSLSIGRLARVLGPGVQ